MKFLSSILAILLLCSGCGYKAKQEYQGKTLRQWEWKAISENPQDRIDAAKALGSFGPRKGLSSLLKLLDDKDKRVKFAADLAMRDMGRSALPYLTELLQDPDPEVRTNASKALVEGLVDMRRDGVPQLLELLQNSEPNVRISAAKGLLVADPDNKSEIPAIEEALGKEDNPHVRKVLVNTLQLLKTQQGKSKGQLHEPFSTTPAK